MSKGHAYILAQWTDNTQVPVMFVAIVSKSINSCARNPDWVLCRVWHLIITQCIIRLSETIKQLKENNLLLLIVSMHNGQREEIEYCLLKGVFVAHGGLQLSCLLLCAKLIHSRLKDEGNTVWCRPKIISPYFQAYWLSQYSIFSVFSIKGAEF